MLVVVGVPTVPSVAMAGVLWGGLIYISTIPVDKRRWTMRVFCTTRDILRGMQTIKAAAWEAAVLSHMRPFRERHLVALTQLGWLTTWSSGLALALPPLSSLAAVVVAYAMGVTLPASFIAFMNLFSLLRSALQQIATGKRFRRGAITGSGKVEDFIKLTCPARGRDNGGQSNDFVSCCVIRADADADVTASFHAAAGDKSPSVNVPVVAPLSDDEVAALWSARADGGGATPLPPVGCLVAVHHLSAKWSPRETLQTGPPFMLQDLSFTLRRGGILGVSGPTVRT